MPFLLLNQQRQSTEGTIHTKQMTKWPWMTTFLTKNHAWRKYSNINCAEWWITAKRCHCEVQDLSLEVMDLKQEVPDLNSGGITQFNHCSNASSMFTETEETGMRGTWRERVKTRDSDDFFGVGIDNDEVEAASGAVQITRHHAAPKYTAIASRHCPPHSGRSTIYVTTRCPSVTRLFVCLSHLAPQPRRAVVGLLVWAWRLAGDVDRQRRAPGSSSGAAARRSAAQHSAANASSVKFTANVGG